MHRVFLWFVILVFVIFITSQTQHEGFRAGGHGSRHGPNRGVGHGGHYGIAHGPTRQPSYGWRTVESGTSGTSGWWWPWWCEDEDCSLFII